MPERYFGKYRGTVVDAVDPVGIARVNVAVPDLAGMLSGQWALPCLSMADLQQGKPVLPQVGAMVWAEFEQGLIEAPVWTGGFRTDATQVPVSSRPPGRRLTRPRLADPGLAHC